MTTEGVFARELGCYIVMERVSGSGRIRSIGLSDEPPESHSQAAEQILDHVLGRGVAAKIDLDFSSFTGFQRDVYRAVMAIPRGQTMTYGQVAEASGHPGAARAVGRAMASNPYILVLPCHRVVASRGLGGYGPGLEMKERILNLEKRVPEP